MSNDQSNTSTEPPGMGWAESKETSVFDSIVGFVSTVLEVIAFSLILFVLIPGVLGGITALITSLVFPGPLVLAASGLVTGLSSLYLLASRTSYGIRLYQYLAPSIYRWYFRCANRQSILKHLGKEGDLLSHVPDHLKADRQMVETAIRSTGSALKYAHPDYQADRSVVEIAVATPTRKRDWPFVFGRGWLLDRAGHALEYTSEEFRDDAHIVRLALEATGEFIFWPDDEEGGLERHNRFEHGSIHKDDHQDITDSILMAASERLRDDRELITQAVWRSSKVFKYASSRLRGDPGLILASISTEFLTGLQPPGWNISGEQYQDWHLPDLVTLEHVSDELFSENKVFYDFLCDLHSGSGWYGEHSNEELIDDCQIDDDNWLKDRVEGTLKEQITKLFGDTDLRKRALRETEWASWYTADSTKNTENEPI